MIILDILETEFKEVKIIRCKKIDDNRGYFTEAIRFTDIIDDERCNFLNPKEFNQINESFSYANVFRGFHFQFNPFMDKLVRCVSGKLIDFALDIRKNSPNFGKLISLELSFNYNYFDWIWIPSGFAHGFYTLEESILEYFCTGFWNGLNEYTINYNDNDIDISLCKFDYKKNILENNNLIISHKDLNGIKLNTWKLMQESNNFLYNE